MKYLQIFQNITLNQYESSLVTLFQKSLLSCMDVRTDGLTLNYRKASLLIMTLHGEHSLFHIIFKTISLNIFQNRSLAI